VGRIGQESMSSAQLLVEDCTGEISKVAAAASVDGSSPVIEVGVIDKGEGEGEGFGVGGCATSGVGSRVCTEASTNSELV